MTELAPRHWTLAAMAALALHAGASVLVWTSDAEGPAAAAGLNGLAVSLGPAGSMPASLEPAAEGLEEVAPVPPQPADAELVEPAEAVPAESAAEPPPEPAPVEEIAELAPPEPDRLAVAEIPEAVAEPVPEPPAEARPDLPASPPEKPRPPAQRAALPEASEPPAEPTAAPQASAAAPTQPADVGISGSTRFHDAGDGNATPGGGVEGPNNDYGAALTAWIQKFHEFPRRLERRRIYGTAIVSFTIDRAGNLLSYEIVRSSGHELVDEAAIETLKRASPMPPVPHELPGAAYTPLPLPIQFNPPS